MYIHDMASYQDVIESYTVESCACHKVRMAARAVTRAYDDALRPVGLRATQLAVLVAIAVEGAMSITALAKFMVMDRSTLTRNLRPLEEEGHVAIGLEGWRRSRTLGVTEKGRSRLAEALPLWKHAQETLRRKLGEQNWVKIHSDLDQLIQAA
jgi:DNA-binding MarR family transcriptional regulator